MKTHYFQLKHNYFSLLLILFLSIVSVSAQDNWELLFNGQDLKNFHQLNGNAKYTIKNGELIGTSKMDTPNSFMATKEMYGDFILEFDVFVENIWMVECMATNVKLKLVIENGLVAYMTKREMGGYIPSQEIQKDEMLLFPDNGITIESKPLEIPFVHGSMMCNVQRCE